MPWRLHVIDGADQNKAFVLPGQGKVTLGRNQRLAGIILHDLYVAHSHCHLEVDGDRVVVRAAADGTVVLVNGVRAHEQEVRSGDVLRVGNSHLRLEPYHPASGEEVEAPAEATDPEKARGLPHLPLERFVELTGCTLSHYTLGEVLGYGHFGVVFRARHDKTGAELALKVLSPELPRTAAEMRTFVDAVKPTLSLRHPNLVSVLNAGKTGPYCWLALEHVEGDSLAHALREPDARRRSHWKPALRMALHLARALEALREHHMVHGNITPANVLLGHDSLGRSKSVKLNDVMLRRAVEGSALQSARLEKKLEAELGYLAPEQVEPDAPVDYLTDLYGLGAVTYARLTGGPPFAGGSPAETIHRILAGSPRKPVDVHSNVPDELSTAVMLLLARHPENRCQSPRDLLDLLEPLAEREGIEA